VGLEALARWNHPTRGAVPPSIFIPIAEHTGRIASLGQWVLSRACRQFREWEDKGLTVPRLGVNVSGAQLRRPSDFERDVAQNFTLWGIPRHAIEFELTESVLMEVTTKQSDALDRLRRLGATIAIDDFGTGYSSLKYLTTYPVDRLKIAQELVAEITSDSRSAVVVRSSIRLAHDLGIEVIAEGVERADQASFLLEAGCEYAQGYYYSRPMSANKVAKLLSRTITASLETSQARSTPSAA
jgi:EAL domain-containing protein (putative c-di-GMP-specific phosphodiesterase class I)